MVLTKLLPKLFFFAISITWQNLLMFSVTIIHDDGDSGADGVDGRGGDQFYRTGSLLGSVDSLLHCSSDRIETWCVMWPPKAIQPVGGKTRMQTLSDFNPNLHLQPIRRLQTASYCPCSNRSLRSSELLHECHYHCADNRLQSRRTGLLYLTVWLTSQQGVFCSGFFKVITAISSPA